LERGSSISVCVRQRVRSAQTSPNAENADGSAVDGAAPFSLWKSRRRPSASTARRCALSRLLVRLHACSTDMGRVHGCVCARLQQAGIVI
jgi:hypothetical protein